MSDTGPAPDREKLKTIFDKLCDRMAQRIASGDLTDKGEENIIKFLAANGINAQASAGSPIGKVLEEARAHGFKLSGSGKLPPVDPGADAATNDRAAI